MRSDIIGQIDVQLSQRTNLSQSDIDSITQLRNAFETRDNLQNQSIEIQKQISKLENASNLDSKS